MNWTFSCVHWSNLCFTCCSSISSSSWWFLLSLSNFNYILSRHIKVTLALVLNNSPATDLSIFNVDVQCWKIILRCRCHLKIKCSLKCSLIRFYYFCNIKYIKPTAYDACAIKFWCFDCVRDLEVLYSVCDQFPISVSKTWMYIQYLDMFAFSLAACRLTFFAINLYACLVSPVQ